MSIKNQRNQLQPPPLPPRALRELVGPLEDHSYDNPTGELVFPEIPSSCYKSVFDFGCGCGRIARQLIQQQECPSRYVGVDLHRGAIRWCRRNLSPVARSFEFHHQNIRNLGLNPRGKSEKVPFPVGDNSILLFVAWSVFTHLTEDVASFYFSELARVLHPNGIAITTWFLFDKSEFPMMQQFKNALYIDYIDPTSAVIFDKDWLKRSATQNGLVINQVIPPAIRGFHWKVYFTKATPGRRHAEIPEDRAPLGIYRPPVTPDSKGLRSILHRISARALRSGYMR